MKFIDELLKDEKVEWKTLGEVCEIVTDYVAAGSFKTISKNVKYLKSKNYAQLIRTKDIKSNFSNLNDFVYVDERAFNFLYRVNLDVECIILPNIGNCGEVYHINPRLLPYKKNVLGPNAIYLRSKINNNKFLYYLFKERDFQKKLYRITSKVGQNKFNKTDLKKLKIPIPTLETQEKIVKILDNFTKYVTELQAELQARNKQYNYYRDMLLSEDYLNKISEKLVSLNNENYVLRLTTLGKIGKFTRGNGLQKKDFREKGKPVIHYGQIYTQYSFSTENTISFTEEDIFSKLRKAKPNDILIATTSENIEDVAKSTVWLGNEEVGFSGDMYSYSTNENSKYIAYYFQTAEFQKQKERKVTGTKLIRIHGEDMEKFTISLPPIEIQNKIVKILDRFQELLSDTKGLLPLEIEQRRKQYEYYREKLLTFDKEERYALSTAQHSTAQRQITSKFFELLKEAAKIADIDVSDKVEWKILSEVAKYHDGTHQTPNYTESGVPFVSVQNIKDLYSTNKFISLEDFQKYKAKPEKNDIFMTRIGDVGTCALVKNNKNLAYYVTLTLIKPNCKVVLSKFLKYFIESSYGKMELSKRILYNATPIKINLNDIGKIKIPLPPLPVQEYIVSILDKFDALVNDLSQGLPKEIELRQKQYEYYREKLLNFEK